MTVRQFVRLVHRREWRQWQEEVTLGCVHGVRRPDCQTDGRKLMGGRSQWKLERRQQTKLCVLIDLINIRTLSYDMSNDFLYRGRRIARPAHEIRPTQLHA
jgi:hypothetical protein